MKINLNRIFIVKFLLTRYVKYVYVKWGKSMFHLDSMNVTIHTNVSNVTIILIVGWGKFKEFVFFNGNSVDNFLGNHMLPMWFVEPLKQNI